MSKKSYNAAWKSFVVIWVAISIASFGIGALQPTYTWSPTLYIQPNADVNIDQIAAHVVQFEDIPIIEREYAFTDLYIDEDTIIDSITVRDGLTSSVLKLEVITIYDTYTKTSTEPMTQITITFEPTKCNDIIKLIVTTEAEYVSNGWLYAVSGLGIGFGVAIVSGLYIDNKGDWFDKRDSRKQEKVAKLDDARDLLEKYKNR